MTTYPADFESAMSILLPHEGGLSFNPADPGGATNFGISLRWLRTQAPIVGDLNHDGDIDVSDIKEMTRDEAVQLYYSQWWLPGPYSQMPAFVSGKIFDLAVNMGQSSAIHILQRGLRAVFGDPIIDDGLFGPDTARRLVQAPVMTLTTALRSEAAGHYRLLAAVNPRLETFLSGWLNRAYA